MLTFYVVLAPRHRTLGLDDSQDAPNSVQVWRSHLNYDSVPPAYGDHHVSARKPSIPRPSTAPGGPRNAESSFSRSDSHLVGSPPSSASRFGNESSPFLSASLAPDRSVLTPLTSILSEDIHHDPSCLPCMWVQFMIFAHGIDIQF